MATKEKLPKGHPHHKEEVLQRIEKAQSRAKHPSYVKRGSMGIEEVSCKCCGGAVRRLAPDDRFHERREINGRTVLVERLALMTLAAYTEVRIVFDDNSAHVTVLCEHCAKKLTVADLEDLYGLDLAEMLKESGSLPWDLFSDRKPVSFEVLPPGQVAL